MKQLCSTLTPTKDPGNIYFLTSHTAPKSEKCLTVMGSVGTLWGTFSTSILCQKRQNPNHKPREWIVSSYTRVYFSRDYILCRGDRYVLAYICAKNLNLIIWHLLHMCYPNKNRFILIFSLLTYCANLCLQFANLCLQFCVIIFRQIFDSALPWAVCCAGVLFI